MKSHLLISLVLSMAALKASTQSTAGITGLRDTSYNISNEYNKHLKSYPNLQIVQEFAYQYITEEKNISYCKTKAYISRAVKMKT